MIKNWLIIGLALGMVGCTASKPAARIALQPDQPTSIVSTVIKPLVDTPLPNTPTMMIETPAALKTQAAPFTGPLTDQERQNLERGVQQFLAKDNPQVLAVTRRIGEEYPGTIDGPLVVAVLQSVGLLTKSTAPHALWMVDAIKDWQKVRIIFPAQDYEIIQWQAVEGKKMPVFYAGDVLYLIPASKKGVGQFVLVSKVDAEGRPWGLWVEEHTKDAFTIQEAMLVNPDAAGGQWAATDGKAGYSGLQVWRKRDRSGQGTLERSLNTVLDRGGNWFVLVKPVGEPVDFQRQPDSKLHPASVIKVPLAMLVVNELDKRGDVGGLQEALQSGPVGAGRNFEQLLSASLVNSEEDATGILEQYALQTISVEKIHEQLSAWGARQTTLEPRQSTARDIATLLEGLYQDRLLSGQASRVILDSLAVVTKGDTARLWKLNGTLPEGSKIYNKRGTLTDPGLIVADAGIIVLPDGKAYVLCVFGYPDGYVTYEDLDAIIGDFALAWYRNKGD